MDYLIFQYFNNLAGQYKIVADLAIFFARFFQYFLIGGAILFLLARKNKLGRIKSFKIIILSFAAALVSRFIFAEIIHLFWSRPRPFLSHEVYKLIPVLTDVSFPSGHMSFLFAFSVAAYLLIKKTDPSIKWVGWLLFSGSFLIGIARIFSGVHYPSDILAGIILGILVGWGSYVIFKKWW
ncbi:MAG: phosphatase PAP2 family protein [Candidatus Portnoybacteria bacterium]|nr:phosphatase PAP2 family protein [Candidatus Portnoybacteria bacterium]